MSAEIPKPKIDLHEAPVDHEAQVAELSAMAQRVLDANGAQLVNLQHLGGRSQRSTEGYQNKDPQAPVLVESVEGSKPHVFTMRGPARIGGDEVMVTDLWQEGGDMVHSSAHTQNGTVELSDRTEQDVKASMVEHFARLPERPQPKSKLLRMLGGTAAEHAAEDSQPIIELTPEHREVGILPKLKPEELAALQRGMGKIEQLRERQLQENPSLTIKPMLAGMTRDGEVIVMDEQILGGEEPHEGEQGVIVRHTTVGNLLAGKPFSEQRLIWQDPQHRITVSRPSGAITVLSDIGKVVYGQKPFNQEATDTFNGEVLTPVSELPSLAEPQK